ncbi:MAG: ribonuclease III [Brevinematales bacterium]|nr:ribonuclease III [Brevinematales bacterium]
MFFKPRNHEKIPKDRLNDLISLENKLGIKFRDISILNKSLIHSSYLKNNSLPLSMSNERLEFIGDAVISMVISEYLYHNYQNLSEGDLSMIKSDVVSRKTMYNIGIDLNIDKYILTYPPLENFDERGIKTIISNTVEALIGAIFVSNGIEDAKKITLKLFTPIIKNRIKNGTSDYKSLLQNYSLKEFSSYPVYTTVSEVGPEHKKEFIVKVFIRNKCFGEGRGFSKKEAEQNAAQNALQNLSKKSENVNQ